jgi:hypothetical protein
MTYERPLRTATASDATDNGTLQPRIYRGDVGEILRHLPTFTRQPFSLERGRANEYRDVIVRQPMDGVPAPVPVAVVSKSYSLLQHRTVLNKALEALASFGVSPDELEATLGITPYGERMKLSLRLPNQFTYKPKVGSPVAVQLVCINSVDRSTKFRALAGWLRLVCTNGMVAGTTKLDTSQRHDPRMDVDSIHTVLAEGLELADLDKKRFSRWRKKAVPMQAIEAWCDGPLREKWGTLAATRTYHIARRGCDVEFGDPFERATPTQRSVKTLQTVPGAEAPANNAFAVAQALSWLASAHRLEEQVQWMEDIQELMNKLFRLSKAQSN